MAGDYCMHNLPFVTQNTVVHTKCGIQNSMCFQAPLPSSQSSQDENDLEPCAALPGKMVTNNELDPHLGMSEPKPTKAVEMQFIQGA